MASRGLPCDGPHVFDFVRPLLFLLSGPLIWFAHFNLIYGTAGFGFMFGLAPLDIQLVAWSSTVAAITLLIALIGRAYSQRAANAADLRDVAQALNCLSLVATVFHAMALGIVAV